MTFLVIMLIRSYQRISRLFSFSGLAGLSGCRQWPTCSEYAIEMIQEYGVLIGIGKGAMRIARCNPFASPL